MQEFEFIKEISKGVPRVSEGLIQGIDDDCAVIEGPRGTCWLVSSDILTENIHFNRNFTGMFDLGRKGLLVNISDIIAMGGIPWFYFVSIACPDDLKSSDVMELMRGLQHEARNHDIILAGGDTTSSDSGFFISITIIGSVLKQNIIYRKGAKQGDGIYVSGCLGSSHAGLESLKKGEQNVFVEKHLSPCPRLKLGTFLAEKGFASAMIDISDGLISDLNHIADLSEVGYRINHNDIPYDLEIQKIALRFGHDLKDYVLSGGEDYELIFTINKDVEKRFLMEAGREEFGCNITKIGQILPDKNKREVLDTEGNILEIVDTGFVHPIGKL